MLDRFNRSWVSNLTICEIFSGLKSGKMVGVMVVLVVLEGGGSMVVA